MSEIHPINPVWDTNSKILILGSFPSVLSRKSHFFYGHPKNRFWKILSSILNEKEPLTIDDKKSLLLNNKIAVWDVIKSCDIKGSADSSIQNVVPNDIGFILKSSKIKMIFTNGQTADKLYQKHLLQKTELKPIVLPSSSPANARYSLEDLINEWSIIKTYLD